MKHRFRLYRRNRGIYYIHDDNTGKQESLQTRDRAEAAALFAAKTQSHRQAHLNLRLARTYMMATDPLADKRTWQMAMEELAGTKRGTWGERWQRAIKQKSFDVIRDLPIMDSQAEHLLKVLRAGTVSTKCICAASTTSFWTWAGLPVRCSRSVNGPPWLATIRIFQ